MNKNINKISRGLVILSMLLFLTLVVTQVSFALPENVALNKIPFVSGDWEPQLVPTLLNNVVDNDFNSVSSGATLFGMVSGYNPSRVGYITINLSDNYNLSKINIKFGQYSSFDTNVIASNLMVSPNGVNWTNIANYSTSSTNEVIYNNTYTQNMDNVRYIRSSSYTTSYTTLPAYTDIRWYEIQAFGVPIQTQPTYEIPINNSGTYKVSFLITTNTVGKILLLFKSLLPNTVYNITNITVQEIRTPYKLNRRFG